MWGSNKSLFSCSLMQFSKSSKKSWIIIESISKSQLLLPIVRVLHYFITVWFLNWWPQAKSKLLSNAFYSFFIFLFWWGVQAYSPNDQLQLIESKRVNYQAKDQKNKLLWRQKLCVYILLESTRAENKPWIIRKWTLTNCYNCLFNCRKQQRK